MANGDRRGDVALLCHSWHRQAEGGVLYRQAQHEMRLRAHAWAGGAAHGLAWHGTLGYTVGPGTT